MIFAQTLTGFLCLVRVYAMYGKSRRILGFLTFTGGISLVTGADTYTCSTVFFPKGGHSCEPL
ncbi:hypothetical protein BC827DRAFT_1250744 [Russula dissimulans]|nr:hypothetical protein BC827DRAFT_1250744 [Russula dissimulans]